jgi:hypothetical protein
MRTSDTQSLNSKNLKQGKDILNKLNFLSKGLKFCKPITGNLLSKIIERLNINSNTLLR